MDARLLNPASTTWNAAIDQIGARLHAGENATLFPYHFLQVVLPKLGGHIVWFSEHEQDVAVGFLLPRYLPAATPATTRAYTLRYHPLLPTASPISPTSALAHAAIDAVRACLPNATIVFYDPAQPQSYHATHQEIGSVCIGRPSAEEAAQIPRLHQQIWGSPPEFLYPADIHSVEFDLGTSLVARVEGQLAAFLFGFYKYGGPELPGDWQGRLRGDLRLESQTMGVLPDFRGMRIANLLKKVQAEQAWARGIGIVNWTADPLQFPNSALNLGLLRAVAFHYFPNFYPFRNDLNRVPASRLELTWLVGSARVRATPLLGTRALMLDLPQHPEIVRVNQGYQQINLEATGEYIAVEIPADWTALQRQQVDEALAWREATDTLLGHYVGTAPGQYVLTGVATDHEQRFLLGQQADGALWQQLGRSDEADYPAPD
jgi:predicted GNAT superfamily acetyltransferase